jgi:hypothetical protein
MKRFLIVSLAVLFAASAVPQDLTAGVSVGIKGGFNLANFAVTPADPLLPYSNLIGITGGVYFSLGFGFIGIQPEILYSRRGTMWNIDEANKVEFLLDYLEVPVLVKFSVLPAGPVRPFIFAGPSFGYLLKATGRMTGFEDVDLKEEIASTEWAAVFGAGLGFKLPGIALSIDGRYHMGLTEIWAEPFEGQTTKNKGFSVMVGIGF